MGVDCIIIYIIIIIYTPCINHKSDRTQCPTRLAGDFKEFWKNVKKHQWKMMDEMIALEPMVASSQGLSAHR